MVFSGSPVLDAPQVIGQDRAPRLALGLLVGRRRRCLAALALQGQQLRLQAGLIFGEGLLEHLALLGVHAFGLGTEPPGLQACQLERDPLDLHVLELDRLRLACDLFVALVELLALLVDELALLTDASQHLRGNIGQRTGAQTSEVLCVESLQIEHARIVQSQSWRGYAEMFGLPRGVAFRLNSPPRDYMREITLICSRRCHGRPTTRASNCA